MRHLFPTYKLSKRRQINRRDIDADNFEQEDIADEMAGILRKFDGLCERAAKMMTKAA